MIWHRRSQLAHCENEARIRVGELCYCHYWFFSSPISSAFPLQCASLDHLQGVRKAPWTRLSLFLPNLLDQVVSLPLQPLPHVPYMRGRYGMVLCRTQWWMWREFLQSFRHLPPSIPKSEKTLIAQVFPASVPQKSAK